ncbi:MAG: hypothetical protein QXH97_04250, partial [Candidatus Bathyarchaeia archaeon]
KSLIINATLIGPITLTTGENEVSYNNNFANYPPPVGGIIIATGENSPSIFRLHPAFVAVLAGLSGAALAYATIKRWLTIKCPQILKHKYFSAKALLLSNVS